MYGQNSGLTQGDVTEHLPFGSEVELFLFLLPSSWAMTPTLYKGKLDVDVTFVTPPLLGPD